MEVTSGYIQRFAFRYYLYLCIHTVFSLLTLLNCILFLDVWSSDITTDVRLPSIYLHLNTFCHLIMNSFIQWIFSKLCCYFVMFWKQSKKFFQIYTKWKNLFLEKRFLERNPPSLLVKLQLQTVLVVTFYIDHFRVEEKT